MVKFHKISQIEKQYPFMQAIAGKDIFNGDFGTVNDGKFTPAADAKHVVMNVEIGDNEGLDKYPITKGENLRILDLDQINGQHIEIYGKQVPTGVAVKDKLKSDENGDLVKNASTPPYVEVTEIIGNKKGIVATVVAK